MRFRPHVEVNTVMNIHELIRELREPSETKIVLLVADGLGGLPLEPGGKTELESARTPNLDACAREGVCGLSIPVLAGHHAGQRPGPPGPVRLRSAGISHRPGHPGSAGHPLPGRPARRGDPRQLLHRGRPGHHHRPPGRPADDRALRRHVPQAAADPRPRRRGLRRAGARAPLRRRLPRRQPGRRGQRHRSAADRPQAARSQGGRPRLGEHRPRRQSLRGRGGRACSSTTRRPTW